MDCPRGHENQTRQMVKKITWTQTADRTFDEITAFLQDNSSLQTAQTFAKTVYSKIDTLVEQPYIGRPSKKAKTVRIINVGKNMQMLYRIEGRTLIISDFFDTRQDPQKRRY